MSNAPARDEAYRKALSLLERIIFLDGHNDLPWVIRNDANARGDVRAFDLARRHDDVDTDIPKLREGRVSAQVWAAFVPSESKRAAVQTLEQIDIILQMNEAHPDVFAPALTADDVVAAKKAGKIASIMAVEGTVGLEGSLSPLRVWRAAGVRLVTLCHNGTLDWVDSATDEARNGGLSPLGKDLVRELNRLGVIVDCAHVSPDVMRQTLDITTAPIVFSHSNARAICDHPRNVPDDVLARVPANDGLVMATFIPNFVSEEVRQWMAPVRKRVGHTLGANWGATIKQYEKEQGKAAPVATLEQVADHIEYLAGKVGVLRVGVGSDFYNGPLTPTGLADVSCFPDLIAEMIRRGWSDGNVAGLAGLNFLRVFRAVEKEGERLRAEEATRPRAILAHA